MGYYSWLHDLLFHLLSAPRSWWPQADQPPMNKRGRKSGGCKPGSPLETMALAGVLAHGNDSLRYWERTFLDILDSYDAGIISRPEMIAQLINRVNKSVTWTPKKIFTIKSRILKRFSKRKHESP